MSGFDQELDEFKRGDLRQYAASAGYRLDKRESSRGSAVMRHDDGDKIIIKQNGNGHYVYFSVHQGHSGTVIDLAQHRGRISLGRVRQELRGFWKIRGSSDSPSLPFFPPLPKVMKDLANVEREWARMEIALAHPYLVDMRGIPATLLESARFAGRVKIDQHGNAVLPHYKNGAVCGFEKKNKGFTGFAPGGEKGLGSSHAFDDDNCIVFAESWIETLSYAALFPGARARYHSIGGALNEYQPGQIKEEIALMPEGAEVIAAMNNDDDGRRLAEVVHRAFLETGRGDLVFRIHEPSVEDNDWNEVLKPTKSNASFPIAQMG